MARPKKNLQDTVKGQKLMQLEELLKEKFKTVRKSLRPHGWVNESFLEMHQLMLLMFNYMKLKGK